MTNQQIALALESLLWPNMAIGNKAILQCAIDALRRTDEAEVARLSEQVEGFVKQVAGLTDTIARYNQQNGAAFTEALAQAQITGLAFIRVNANGNIQVLPTDRVRISVIQAVEERTAAARQHECVHDWQSEFNGVGYDDICSNCGAIK